MPKPSINAQGRSLPSTHRRSTHALLWLASLGIFLALLIASRIVPGPVVQADEGSYLLNAAAIASKLTRSALVFDYYSGYSLLLAPAFLLTAKFSTAYGIALGINALLVATLPFALFRIVGAAFSEIAERDRAFIAIGASLYAPMLILSQYALSDTALTVVYAWALVAGIHALRNGKAAASILCGGLLGFLFVIHARGAPLAASVLIAFALHALSNRSARRQVALMWVCAIAAGASHRIVERMAGKFPGFSAAAPNAGEIVSHFMQATTWQQALLNAGGATLVAVVGSAGLIVVLAIWTIHRLRQRRSFADLGLTIAMASLSGLLTCILVTAVFFSPPTRADHIAYGRYLLATMPLAVALGLAAVRSREHAIGRLLAAAVVGVGLALLVGVGFAAWPSPAASDWNAVNSVELYVPYKLAGHPLDGTWIGLWYAGVVLLVLGSARWRPSAACWMFAALNVVVATYAFIDCTVYARTFYAKNRTLIDAVRTFSETTGNELCIRIDPALSGWHQVDFRSRLYDQLPESAHKSPCIPALIADAATAKEPPPGMILVASEATSPTGSFPVVLFMRDEPRARSFQKANPLVMEKWLPLPPEQRRANLRFGGKNVSTLQVARAVASTLAIVATNTSDDTWFPGGRYPVRLGIRIQLGNSTSVREDRVEFAGNVAAGESRSLEVPIGPIDEPGDYIVTIGVVQEQIAWFPTPLTFDLHVTP